MKVKRFLKRIFSYVKRFWNKMISFLCAIAIAITTIAYSYPVLAAAGSVAAGAAAISAVIGVIGSIKEFCENCQWVWETVQPIIDAVKSANSSALAEQQEYYRCYWSEIVSKGQLSESKFREYWTFVVTNGDDTSMEASYPGFTDTYAMLIETVASGLSLDSLCESIFSGSGQYSVDENNNPVVSASTYQKDVVDYWSDYYKPHENAQQFVWSYQTRGCSTESPYSLGSPDCPIYMDTHGNWGGKNWDSFYFMLFYTDDSVGTYYSSRYIRCYPFRENDSVYICFDFYDLDSGSLIDTEKTEWNVVNYPYVSVYHSVYDYGNNSLYFPYFASYSDYKSDKSVSKFSVSVHFDNMVNTSYVQSNKSLTDMRKSVSFTPNSNKNDDYGFICSSEPFQLFGSQTSIDYDKIPDNYTITINGDTIYDYDITNPDTGKTTKITNYITNNYTIPDDGGSSGDSGSGSGTVSGNVTVGGKVDVSGKIEIDTKPIDININVNNSGSGSGSSGTSGAGENIGDYIDTGTIETDINGYLDKVPKVSKDFIDYLKDFFAWLPPEIYGLLILGLIVAIFCRISGR